LELKARGRHRRRDPDNRVGGSVSEGERYEIGSNRSGSRRHQDRLHFTGVLSTRDRHIHGNPVDIGNVRITGVCNRGFGFPRDRQPIMLAMDAYELLPCAEPARLQFLDEIERAPNAKKFMASPFNSLQWENGPVGPEV